MRVLVAVALPGSQEVETVELAQGASLADALSAARVRERHPDLAIEAVGIWGKRCAPETVLREGDRVEVYRALTADAKAMRRARAGLRSSPRSRSGP
jgi:putative ubiquitin-RnfH superfamily antitoxin RatB of RatAB toxin-antitoxin module